jgi:hypothetical protein
MNGRDAGCSLSHTYLVRATGGAASGGELDSAHASEPSAPADLDICTASEAAGSAGSGSRISLMASGCVGRRWTPGMAMAGPTVWMSAAMLCPTPGTLHGVLLLRLHRGSRWV